MEFNQSLPIQKQPQYNEGSRLASSRDDRNNSFLWKKGDNVSAQLQSLMQANQKLSREVSKMRRRIVGGFVETPQDEQMFPFKIYQINNASATDAQKKVYTDLGLNIDDYTIQIRGGLISTRAYINQPNFSNLFGNQVQGNFEDVIYCANTDSYRLSDGGYFYYQPTANTFSTQILPDSGDTLITATDGQIAINPTVNGNAQFGSAAASFWIEIVDDPLLGLYSKLWARMITYDPPNARNPTFFPSGPNIFPIGIFGLYADPNSLAGNYLPFLPFTSQIQSGNLVNRFPPTRGNQRGIWSVLFASLPAPSGSYPGTNLAFYPGDIVRDDTDKISNTDSNGDTIQSYGIYQCIANDPIFPTVAQNPIGSSDWILISNLLTDYAP